MHLRLNIKNKYSTVIKFHEIHYRITAMNTFYNVFEIFCYRLQLSKYYQYIAHNICGQYMYNTKYDTY